MSPRTLRDHVHLEHLAAALWSRPGAGRATVMVGAGMSMNAEPATPSACPMMGWAQLSGLLVDAMYPPGTPDPRGRERAFRAVNAPGGFLRIAEEASCLLGRNVLDSLVAQAVPDLDHEPGPMHRLLLELPWADVLTTNYDTLLERTTSHGSPTSYSLVNTPEDLGTATRPRIVKLHGSLPSTRPFVLTEEDYRLYPSRNPAFVNLARQAILETSLCMVGFSGDDPNFLGWAGWVRDILGAAARRLYLCGVLDLGDAQRRLLTSWGIVPIDLSDLFPAAEWPDPGSRHASALQWLLLALRSQKPPDPLVWPLPGTHGDVQVPVGFPGLSVGAHVRTAIECPFP